MSISFEISGLQTTCIAGNDGATISLKHNTDALIKQVIAAINQCLGAKPGTVWHQNRFPTNRILAVCADPIGILTPFLRDGRRLHMKDLIYLRILGIMLTRFIAASGEHIPPDRHSIDISDFSLLEQTRIGGEKPYAFASEIDTSCVPPTKTKKRTDRPASRSSDDEEELPPTSSMLVPFVQDVANITALDYAITNSLTPAQLELIPVFALRSIIRQNMTMEDFMKESTKLLVLAARARTLIKIEENGEHEAKLDWQLKREITKETAMTDLEIKKQRELFLLKKETRFVTPRKHLTRVNLTDQRAQIVEMWLELYSFSHNAGDEMILCKAHPDTRDFHFISIYGALAFDTELGEPCEDRRETLAPGCAKGLMLMGVKGATVISRPTGLENELLHYYSSAHQKHGVENLLLLRVRMPCNVTGKEKLICTMEWDHIVATEVGGSDTCENKHLISRSINTSVGDNNTVEWAARNGHGPLKVKPPSARELAEVLANRGWWSGKESNSETAIRMDRARLESPEPFEGVLLSIQRKKEQTGQSTINFARQATASCIRPSSPQPQAEEKEENEEECGQEEEEQKPVSVIDHFTSCFSCGQVVTNGDGRVLPSVGMRVRNTLYCSTHAVQAPGYQAAFNHDRGKAKPSDLRSNREFRFNKIYKLPVHPRVHVLIRTLTGLSHQGHHKRVVHQVNIKAPLP